MQQPITEEAGPSGSTPGSEDADRKAREAAFHDRAYAEDVRDATKRFYFVVRSSEDCYATAVVDRGRDRRVLEYGCGPGSYAWLLQEHGAHVTGIDISQEAIDQAREEARRRGLTDVEFHRMDAEALRFPDGSFNLVCGSGILHHLDLERAYAQVRRVLKADGAAVFYEPLGHNQAINAYRKRTPDMRTEDEHPLLMEDLDRARSYFRRVSARFFHLSSLAAVPLRGRRGFGAIVRTLDRVDQTLFRMIPWTRRFAWMTVLVLEGPNPLA